MMEANSLRGLVRRGLNFFSSPTVLLWQPLECGEATEAARGATVSVLSIGASTPGAH